MFGNTPSAVAEAARVLRFRQIDPAQLERIAERPEILHELDADPGKVHAVCLAARPGMELFLTVLEHEHFDPLDPAREPLLESRAVIWMDMAWTLVSIPRADRRAIHLAAARAGLRPVDGVPMVIAGGGIHWWPMRSSRVTNLENLPGAPPIDRAEEERQCEAIREASRRRYRETIQGTN
jgi:hypothetical protein